MSLVLVVEEGSAELDIVLEAQSLFFREVMTLAFQKFLPPLPLATREQ